MVARAGSGNERDCGGALGSSGCDGDVLKRALAMAAHLCKYSENH